MQAGVPEYYSKLSSNYDLLMQMKKRVLVDNAQITFFKKHINTDSKILDVGCGTGTFLSLCSNGTGVDLSKGMVEIAKKKGLNVLLGDATALPFPDNSFDYVISFKAFAHVKDWKKMLSEIVRVAKYGVMFDYYSFFSIKSLHGLLNPKTYIRFNTKPNIQKELRANGFEIVCADKYKKYVSLFAQPVQEKPAGFNTRLVPALSVVFALWFFVGLVSLAVPNPLIETCDEKCQLHGYDIVYKDLSTNDLCFCRYSINRKAAWVSIETGELVWDGSYAYGNDFYSSNKALEDWKKTRS